MGPTRGLSNSGWVEARRGGATPVNQCRAARDRSGTLRHTGESRVSDGPQDGEGSSIWDRLRRRKVVQWTLAYAAGAWACCRACSSSSMPSSGRTAFLKLGTVAALVGLPLVVAIAWFRGERGYQRATRAELTVVTLLFLLGGGIFWYYQHTAVALKRQVDAPAATPSPTTPPAFPNDRSIAVLPFVNMSSDEEQEYFSDGISEELLNLLAQIPELRVIARSSSFSFKDKQADIAEIASKLNVATCSKAASASPATRCASPRS